MTPRGFGGMPTKTRLDPPTGGDGTPGGPDGAHGSGPEGKLTSASSAPPLRVPGDVAGFVDSLTSLASHLREREAFEAGVRRGWAVALLGCAGLLTLEGFLGYFAIGTVRSIGGLGAASAPQTTSLLAICAIATALAALALLGLAASAPWRTVPDSADRITLHHEDSPLRDRIRVSQWILLDAAFTRFAYHERLVQVRIAYGIVVVSASAAAAIALPLPVLGWLAFAAPAAQTYDMAANAMLALFLVLTLVTIAITMRGAKLEFLLAQHYGRQVLSFDDAFGHFMPAAERHRVEELVAKGAGAKKPTED